MLKSIQILAFVVCLGSLSLLQSEVVCDDVFPHLSFGIGYSTQELCQAGGGCWETSGCFFPKVPGYLFTSISNSKGEVKGNLTLINSSGALGPDYRNLDLAVTQESATRTHVLITPSAVEGIHAWQVPESIIPRPSGKFQGESDSVIEISSQSPFQMKIKSGEDDIFVLSKMLIFQEQYVQIVLSSPSNVVATYGFGESSRAKQALQKGSQYTLWNTDWWAGGFDASLYGTHPFYIQITSDGRAHGVMFLNSNAMELTLDSDDTHGNVIGIQTTGGVVDFYVFSGPTPLDVIKQYQEVIGKPSLIPYWSLGFHNCRWGYKDLQHIKDVVTNYSTAGIPLETQWADIDYMQNYLDFTYDAVKFPQAEMKAFVDRLHEQGQHFVPIVDPGIYAVPATDSTKEYPALVKGLEQNVFIRDLYGVEPYLGQVWPGATYFPDWFAANTTSYWTEQLEGFHDMVPYDGIWIDMNEVSNFCNPVGKNQVCALDPDSTCPDGCCLKCETVDPTNKYDFPPYTPHVAQGALSAKTISMSTLHANNLLEYYTHPFYGLQESIATKQAVIAATGERAFVLSRSTYMSSGVYAAHWTGDNAARWADLAASIITMNNLALFGISMTGADICGFAEDTTSELCARWIEVGAFSPFSRNHNELDSADQELYRWSDVTTAAINVLNMRYRLLPYLYTLMSSATLTGATVMNALWVNFPKDSQAVVVDAQYMWSNGILFTPVLTEGATSVTGYFPTGNIWYPLFDTDTHGPIDATTAGQTVTLSTSLHTTNAHVRGGTVIPMQNAAMTTAEVQRTPYTLLIAMDSKHEAQGSLFLDNGKQIELDNYVQMAYSAKHGVFTSKVEKKHGKRSVFEYVANTAVVNTIRILDASVTDKMVCKATAQVTKHMYSERELSHEQTALNVIVNHKLRALEVDMSAMSVHVTSEYTVTYSCV